MPKPQMAPDRSFDKPAISLQQFDRITVLRSVVRSLIASIGATSTKSGGFTLARQRLTRIFPTCRRTGKSAIEVTLLWGRAFKFQEWRRMNRDDRKRLGWSFFERPTSSL
jgi:hypothetical protein